MTLYEQIVLHHYKFHTKNQPLEVAMSIACRQADEAMNAFIVKEPVSYTTRERLVEWSLSQAPEVRTRTQARYAADAYIRALEGK